MNARNRFVVVGWVAALVALFVAFAAACATPAHKAGTKLKPPTEDSTAGAVQPKDTHFPEVKKAAAEQLQCPIEKINVVCLRRDSDGECISVRADGCNNSYEYQFGDV